MEKRSILAIGAHAGDMEITCGGVLIKAARAGTEVHMLHLSLGGRGHPRKSPAVYGPQKEEEARECARRIGATAHFLPYQDAEVPDSDEIKIAVANVIRQVQPATVITHWRSSMHPDHAAAHRVTDIGVLWAALEGMGQGPVWRGVQRVIFTENWEDPEGFTPYLYVDVTAERDAWREAVQAYELFRGGVYAFDYLGYYTALGKVRGAQIGVEWAQAFAVWPWAQRQRVDML
ncbi:MAG: PIG-L family deacetylase [Anaerolineae bacterium]|nr:PIG-L family deacetylase [Anaerolineae bacterium]